MSKNHEDYIKSLPEERQAKIEKRRKELAEAALDDICNRGKLEFKAPPDLIRAVYEVAGKKQVFVSELLRDLVIKGLCAEDDSYKTILEL